MAKHAWLTVSILLLLMGCADQGPTVIGTPQGTGVNPNTVATLQFSDHFYIDTSTITPDTVIVATDDAELVPSRIKRPAP